MKVGEIKTPVSAIAGIGPALTKTLAKINIFTVGDLLQYFPKDYEDRSVKVFLKDFQLHKKVHTIAKVTGQEWFGYGRMRTLKILINDGTASAELVCFNRDFLAKTLVPDTIVSVTGQFSVKYGKLQSSAFEVNKLPESMIHENLTSEEMIKLSPPDSRVLPVYHLTDGLTQKVLYKAITAAVQQYAHGIDNELPESIIEKRQLLQKQMAITLIHMPDNLQQAITARRTLIYEELYHFQYAIAARSFRHRGTIPSADLSFDLSQQNNQSSPRITNEEFVANLSPLQKEFLAKLPFPLTQDQRNVIHEMNLEIDKGYMERNSLLVSIEKGTFDIKNYRPPFSMARLLQGDVGSGKTLTALFVCLRVISYKGQCAIMAPTEILSRQHAETTVQMLKDLGVRVAFLTGNVKSAGRNLLLKALKDGEIDIIIGTHALFSSQVIYKDLQFVVIDEQHRFGVMQRQAILAKGRKAERNGITFDPHLLMMSATPIPQTLALTVFGDLDVSVIKTMPEGRKEIRTFLIQEGEEEKAYSAVRKELELGHQAYFVYPAIDSDYGIDSIEEENECSSRKIQSAEKNFELLSKKIYPDYKCALVHSKVDEEQQVQILQDFYDNKIQVLAATTVIEVGVNVPNATCMVIEQADRFGMAQLHQLRGRVGRGNFQSYCILIYSKNLSDTGKERMKALRTSTDGFFIAEQDLKTRGPGEMNGTVQSGALELGIADIVRDRELLIQARTDSFSQFEKHF